MRPFALLTLLLASTLAGCNGLFYHPDARVHCHATQLPVPCEEVAFPSLDGTRLTGWFLTAAGEARATLVYFHGNGANVTAHAELLARLAAEGFHVLAVDYRGYGRSTGEPTRAGVHQDAQAALAYARMRPDVDPERLLVFGQSLGGAVGLAALGEGARDGVRGVVVEGTFCEYQDVANSVVGGTPFTWPVTWLLVSDDHSPHASLERLAGIPLLVIHGDADAVVPYEHGQALHACAPGPKRLLTVPRGRHLDALRRADVRAQVLDFLRGCVDERRVARAPEAAPPASR